MGDLAMGTSYLATLACGEHCMQQRSTHLARFALYFVLHPQNGDVSLPCSRVESNDHVTPLTLLKHL